MPGDTRVTNLYMAKLESTGHTIIDLRGKLPINPYPNYRYGSIPLTDVKYGICHWTGDTFTQTFWDKIIGTGSPQAGGFISPLLTQEQEIRLLEWYSQFHISKDNTTWGGIAYGTLIFPSGRIYVTWNIGTLTYHAFSANRYSYAICCPIANRAQPTKKQSHSLVAVLNSFNSLEDIPANTEKTYGHQEVRFLDPRNQTQCPGTLLPLIQAYRRGEDTSPWTGDLPQEVQDQSDRDLDTYAQTHGLGQSRGTAYLDKPYAHGKVSFYTGHVLWWRNPGDIVDITENIIDDGITLNQDVGLLVKYGSW